MKKTDPFLLDVLLNEGFYKAQELVPVNAVPCEFFLLPVLQIEWGAWGVGQRELQPGYKIQYLLVFALMYRVKPGNVFVTCHEKNQEKFQTLGLHHFSIGGRISVAAGRWEFQRFQKKRPRHNLPPPPVPGRQYRFRVQEAHQHSSNASFFPGPNSNGSYFKPSECWQYKIDHVEEA